MKKMILAVVLILTASIAKAQSAAVDPAVPAINASAPSTSLNVAPVIFGSPQAIVAADWIKIGGAFGPKNQAGVGGWQFGFDKSETLGACVGYNVPDKEVLGGYCRDALILAHRGEKAFHLGGAYLYDSNHAHATVVARIGINVGPATSATLNAIADKIPAAEALAGWQAPKPLAYIGKISTLDFMAGPRLHPLPGEHKIGWGPEAKVDLPLEDLFALFGK